jgi:hypothetical protein
MAVLKNKLGRIPCDCCGHPAVLKENEAGTLTIACDECDVSSFAKKGTAAAARWRAKLPKAPAEAAPAAPKPAAPVSVPKAPAQEATEQPPAPPKPQASAWAALGVR